MLSVEYWDCLYSIPINQLINYYTLFQRETVSINQLLLYEWWWNRAGSPRTSFSRAWDRITFRTERKGFLNVGFFMSHGSEYCWLIAFDDATLGCSVCFIMVLLQRRRRKVQWLTCETDQIVTEADWWETKKSLGVVEKGAGELLINYLVGCSREFSNIGEMMKYQLWRREEAGSGGHTDDGEGEEEASCCCL